MIVNRRRFLIGSAAAVAGAAGWRLRGGGFPPPPPAVAHPDALASGGLRKCLSMGPVNSPEGDDQDLRAHENLSDVRASGSHWVKLWLRWDQVQPRPPTEIEWAQVAEPSNPGYPFLRSFDAQIALARSQDPPLGVVLTLYRFPQWSNGTASLVEGTPTERAFEPHDRLTRAQHGAGDPENRRRPLAFRVPPMAHLQVDGYWGRWVRFLLERYERYGDGVVLELLNEPNLQWWPQHGPSVTGDPFDPGPPEAARRAARMMDTAQRIAAERASPTPLAGPAVADYPESELLRGDTRTFTAYDSFIVQVLDELDALRFRASGKLIWTHHNYVDMMLDRGSGGNGRNRAAAVRELLAGRWSGWPQDGRRSDLPGLWLTEGGVDLRSGRVRADVAEQARLVGRNLERMADRRGDGVGIGMVTNYLNYTELHYDTGLRGALEQGGARRPVGDVWRVQRSVY